MDQKLLQKIKSGEVTINSLLNPERHISDFRADDLRVNVLPSGFPSLDEMMLIKENKNELIVVGGRPSAGKSAFMFQLAMYVSRSVPVHVFSLEMSTDTVQARMVAIHTGKSLTSIQNGKISAAELARAQKEFATYKYTIDDRGGLSVNEICDAAFEVARKYGTKLLVIDYLQFIKAARSHSRDTEIGEITRALKDLGKELRIPIVLGSQLNRDSVRRGLSSGNFKPTLSDLRDSGAIEQDADVVLFVHREYPINGERPGEADIVVAKNRNGSTGEVLMEYVQHQTRFIDNGGIV